MHPRSSKRTRVNYGGAYRDAVPMDTDYQEIHSREGRLRRIGGAQKVFTPALNRTVHQDTSGWQNTTTWDPVDDTNYALDPNDGAWYDEALNRDVMQEDFSAHDAPLKTLRRSRVSKRPHVVWMDLHRQTYLEEEMRWEGRGDFSSATDCPDCKARGHEPAEEAQFRCRECFLPDLVCAACCVKRHRSHPFHRVEKWTGLRFITTSLKSMGLKVQLNHSGMHCANPIGAHQSMLILHTNGIHEIDIHYCGCTRAIPTHTQLLRRGLYPASQVTIRTCATFELLRQLHMLALTTKSNTYDFYRALEKLTVNTGMDVPKSRYRALMRMVLQWRHLKLLKRGGRGHEPTGAAGTATGELAIMCPSCPRPGVNLEVGWEDAPVELQFLYAMIVCMDANFRLKNQMVSNYSQDPGLGTGWAYMVPRRPYERYVLSRAGDEDISTCVGLQALAKAYTKYSKGLRYTGVGLVACGRSEMILPVAVGNLQKGERYANMDYAFGSAIHLAHVALILISYDIACQWFVNLFKRMHEHWPEEIKPHPDTDFQPAIPKLHEPMHGKANHHMYSLNYIPGVGNSDCEVPERIWGPHNALGNSTKTQGPGSRHDVLDDHFSFWNWLKKISLGVTLAKRYKAAVAERNIQAEGHRGLTNSLDPAQVKVWEAMCIKWEEASYPKKDIKNPYQTDGLTMTETQVRRELHLEEEGRLSRGGESLHATSASAFIMLGLDLEDTQRRIRRLAQETPANPTARKASGLIEQRNLLRSRIRGWELLLPIYMPGLLQYQSELKSTASIESDNPEEAPLWLPSKVEASARRRVSREGLPKVEERLRSVQLEDALEAVHHILKIKARMVAFKNKNVRGQREGTRSRTIIDRVHQKARASADKYRAARIAKLALSGPGEWQNTYRVLLDSDIRGYQDPALLRPRPGRQGVWEDDELDALTAGSGSSSHPSNPDALLANFSLFNPDRERRDGTGETRRTLSWIWTAANISTNPDDVSDDILRAEWAKSRARAARSREEVLLLKEEMRRTLVFLDWRARWWRSKPVTRENASRELAEGLKAYSEDQASLQEQLCEHFRMLWKNPLSEAEVGDQAGSADKEDEEDEGGDNTDDEHDISDGDDDPLDDEDEFPEDPV